MRKILRIILSVCLLCCIATPVNALSENKVVNNNSILVRDDTLPGTWHEDGSYQFSPEEVARLNEFENQSTRSVYTLAEKWAYAAPEFFDSLPTEIKNEISTACDCDESSVQGRCTELTYLANTSVTISNYGASLKGVTLNNREQLVGYPEDCSTNTVINEIYSSDTGVRYGYTVNASLTTPVSATTIIDPPTGTYYSFGTFIVPNFCNYHGYLYRDVSARTGDHSYTNMM